MPSPKKASPGKKEGKKSPGKNDGRNSPKGAKKGAKELDEIEQQIFARKRYDTMDAIFTIKKENIKLYAKSIHIYEILNKLPSYQQFCNSNKGSPKSKGSPKKSPTKSPKKGAGQIAAVDDPNMPAFEPAIITGAVAVKAALTKANCKIFVEITAEFRYFDHSKVPPYPEAVSSVCQCYRDYCHIYPYNFEQPTESTEFTQNMTSKLKNDFGKAYKAFPFSIDLTGAPDSLFFNRPFYPNYSSGIFWTLRAFVNMSENCITKPENEVKMEFFKFTISPSSAIMSMREKPAVEYTRFCARDDTGNLMLKAQLDREIYFHGEDINVGISIENGSSRHVVSNVAIFVEQTYKLQHQLPHDMSVPIGEVIINEGEFGLPVLPRSKNWTKEVSLKPTYDKNKYNLALDGHMPRDEKIFLASSTLVIVTTKEPIPIEPEIEQGRKSPEGKQNSPGKKNAKPTSPKKKEKSPKKESPKKGKAVVAEEAKEEPEKVEPPVQTYKEISTLTNKQTCRKVFITYDVVVRLNLRTPEGDEGGNPMVRVPFILTREKAYIDKLTNPRPPTWALETQH